MNTESLVADTSALRAEITRRYVKRLEAVGNPIVADEFITRQTMESAEAILRSFLPISEDFGAPDSSVLPPAIGKARALQRIHPSFSLAAAGILFESGMTVLGERLGGSLQPDEAFSLASRFQTAIMERITTASSQYVDVLVEKVDKSNQHERLSVSRHLHDNVAHGIAAAIQRLELSRRSDGSHTPDNDEGLLGQALHVLRETLQTVREVATTLRNVVGDRNLDTALAELLEDSVGYSGRIELATAGNIALLASHLKEELFIILREGIRNAFQHGTGMTNLRVVVEAGPAEVFACVEDDGPGFSSPPTAYSHIGIQSMRERTELLGGSWSMEASKGEGCRIVIRIPVADGNPVVFA
ncbi:histidine kinase [Arthrobacter sp. NQ7]|uniref:sensor histidine kinase n=1 Tax=Arthrobacter sp. NQ7 TaxID=3032303 RepID=UPI002410A025|nr:histidine kinase [Arthrobacter sp. NQ7]MDJ0459823.1 histidine kinase [Arthrobacter sp. NQ7]